MFKRKTYTALLVMAIISLALNVSASFAVTLTWTFDENGINDSGPGDFALVVHEFWSRVTDGEVDIYLRNIGNVSISTVTVAFKTVASDPPDTPYPSDLVSRIDVTDPAILACNDPNYSAPDQPGCMNVNSPPDEMRFQHYFTDLSLLDLGFTDPIDSIRSASLRLESLGGADIVGIDPTQHLLLGHLRKEILDSDGTGTILHKGRSLFLMPHLFQSLRHSSFSA